MQACANIAWPSISKLSLNWMSVPAINLLALGLALVERHLPQVAAVKVEQIEGDHDDLRRLTLEFVLQHREVGGAIGGWDHDLAVDHRRRCLDVPGVVRHLLEAMRPVMTAPGEDLDGFVGQVDLEAGRLMRSADQTSTPARDRERRGALLADRMRGSIPEGRPSGHCRSARRWLSRINPERQADWFQTHQRRGRENHHKSWKNKR